MISQPIEVEVPLYSGDYVIKFGLLVEGIGWYSSKIGGDNLCSSLLSIE